MKTRNLLILAFACGLAILVAGGIKIFQVASSDDKVETLPFGTVAEIGPMTVRVMDVTEADDALLVRVEIRGPGPDDLGAHWKLLVAGEPGPLDPIELPAGEGPTCAGTS